MATMYLVEMLLLFIAVLGDEVEQVEEDCGGRDDIKNEDDIRELLQLPATSGLAYRSKIKVGRRSVAVRYEQVMAGIPIYGSLLTAQFDRDGLLTGKLRGEMVRRFSGGSAKVNRSPLEVLKALAGDFLPSRIVKNMDISDFVDYELSLVWYPVNARAPLRLSYLCRFKYAPNQRGDPLIPKGVVDATNRRVLVSWNDAGFQQPSSLPGVGGNAGRLGKVTYSDMRVTALSDGLTCQYSTNTVQVQSLDSATTGKFVPTKFKCSDTVSDSFDYVNGGYSAMNDVAKLADVVISIYASYFNLTSPTGTLPVKFRVHYGVDYANSFWDGTYVYIGDGGAQFYPLTSLDIIGHEIGHGFTQSFSNLQLYGEPGGINEAFSDAAGQAAVYSYTGAADFRVGSMVSKNGTAIRDMCNPRSDNVSIDHISQYKAGMDVHYSSGLYNKAFCLLAKTVGWTVADAFQAFAYANAVYWTQLTSFSRGVCGVQYAAAELDPPKNPADVTRAFAAVGLQCA